MDGGGTGGVPTPLEAVSIALMRWRTGVDEEAGSYRVWLLLVFSGIVRY